MTDPMLGGASRRAEANARARGNLSSNDQRPRSGLAVTPSDRNWPRGWPYPFRRFGFEAARVVENHRGLFTGRTSHTDYGLVRLVASFYPYAYSGARDPGGCPRRPLQHRPQPPQGARAARHRSVVLRIRLRAGGRRGGLHGISELTRHHASGTARAPEMRLVVGKNLYTNAVPWEYNILGTAEEVELLEGYVDSASTFAPVASLPSTSALPRFARLAAYVRSPVRSTPCDASYSRGGADRDVGSRPPENWTLSERAILVRDGGGDPGVMLGVADMTTYWRYVEAQASSVFG
jgi:hypothetical protein